VALPEDVDLTPRQHRILIVDDEPEIRRFCRYALQAKDGPEIDEAEDGVQALAMLGERGYDLVVTDLCMPGMAGSELCGRIRENLARPKLANLKIIVMSGGASPDEMANMTLQVADDYVTKPVSVVQLRAKVAAALRLKDAQDRSDLLSAHLAAGNQDLQKALAQRDLDLISARKSVVGALLNTISLREGQGSAHCQRMERYCRCLAEEAAKETVFADAIDTAFIESLATGAPLHDIGNIALPDNIRLKAGELSPNERLLMQTHTTTGAELLQILVNQHGMVFLRTAAEIARHHHERFDGGGYPDGLAGNEIPLAARLVAICDVYDALRSRRSYKPPMSHAAAVRVITNISRKQFDPALLPAFERCAPSFERIFTELSPT
jgi:response regulator RpfG family c-di-GMP phosphodiesterase